MRQQKSKNPKTPHRALKWEEKPILCGGKNKQWYMDLHWEIKKKKQNYNCNLGLSASTVDGKVTYFRLKLALNRFDAELFFT